MSDITTNKTGGLAEIRLDRSDIRATAKDLAGIKNGYERAYSRALNKTTAGVRADLVQFAREEYNFKAASVRKRITIKKASWSKLESSVVSRGKSVPLYAFTGTRQTKKKGLIVNIRKSTGPQTIPSGFTQKSKKSGTKVALIRSKVGGERVPRYPVEALYGPHPESVYNTPENWKKISRKALERLQVNFAHETDYVLEKFGN